ncbi:MAG: hypothetical protein ABSE55_05250 [Terracidiphilus sp.]|jgi:hypothetical protein
MYTIVFYFHFDSIDNAANWRRKKGRLLEAKRRVISNMYEAHIEFAPVTIIIIGINNLQYWNIVWFELCNSRRVASRRPAVGHDEGISRRRLLPRHRCSRPVPMFFPLLSGSTRAYDEFSQGFILCEEAV